MVKTQRLQDPPHLEDGAVTENLIIRERLVDCLEDPRVSKLECVNEKATVFRITLVVLHITPVELLNVVDVIIRKEDRAWQLQPLERPL
jgi:hypothetical protein